MRDRVVKDIKLQKSLFNHYKIPTLPLHSQQGSSDKCNGKVRLTGILTIGPESSESLNDV